MRLSQAPGSRMPVQGAANFFLRQSAFGSYGAMRFAISKPSASVARLFVIGPMTTPMLNLNINWRNC